MNRLPLTQSENLYLPELKENLQAIATAEHFVLDLIQTQVDCAVQKVVEQGL